MIVRAVATMGVSVLEILSADSGKYRLISIAHAGQQEVSMNGCSPVATFSA